METGVSARKPRGSRWRLTLAAEIATILGLVVAIIALVLSQRHDDDSGTAAPPAASRSTTNPPPPGPPTPTTPAPTGALRYLTDLTPDSGAGFVQRVDAHSLRMMCGTGESGDRFREVGYSVPAAGSYRSFRTVISAAGPRDTQIRAQLFVDNQEIQAPVVTAGSSAPLAWTGEHAGRLRLRITCDQQADVATFTDPALAG